MAYQCETDLDLPPVRRTEGNLWKAKYFEYYREMVNVNKGVRRLHDKLVRAKARIKELEKCMTDNDVPIPRNDNGRVKESVAELAEA